MTKKFYSVKEVAAILGVSKSLIYAGVQQGKIPHRRIMGNGINLTKRGRNFMIVRKGLL